MHGELASPASCGVRKGLAGKASGNTLENRPLDAIRIRVALSRVAAARISFRGNK